MTNGLDQFAASAAVVWFLQLLKNSRWFPLLTNETEKLNRGAAVVLAGLSAFGVHFTWAHPAPGVWNFGLTGLTAVAVILGLWHWLTAFATQQVIFRATRLPAVQASLVQGGNK